MSIVTKRGDGGLTDLLGGKRIEKSSKIMQAIGSVDEANSYLGIIGSIVKSKKLKNMIQEVQSDLFTIGAILAGEKNIYPISDRIRKLEQEIDEIEAKLPVQKNFILPGGNKVAAGLFYARSLVRHAERNMVNLKKKSVFEIPDYVYLYINRLSDYLFILARYENFREKINEKEWKKEK